MSETETPESPGEVIDLEELRSVLSFYRFRRYCRLFFVGSLFGNKTSSRTRRTIRTFRKRCPGSLSVSPLVLSTVSLCCFGNRRRTIRTFDNICRSRRTFSIAFDRRRATSGGWHDVEPFAGIPVIIRNVMKALLCIQALAFGYVFVHRPNRVHDGQRGNEEEEEEEDDDDDAERFLHHHHL